MSEADYEYEVMRCELLGLPPPERQPLPPKSSNDEEGEDFHVDEENIESDQQVGVESEQLKNTSGRLDELNSILNVTQKKLNRFKAVCGSLTSLLKIRVPSSGKDTASSSNLSSRASIASNTEGQAEAEAAPSSDDTATATSTTKPTGRTAPRDIDRTTQLGSQVDALDSILDKAEHAEMSMSHQNKIMKSFLK